LSIYYDKHSVLNDLDIDEPLCRALNCKPLTADQIREIKKNPGAELFNWDLLIRYRVLPEDIIRVGCPYFDLNDWYTLCKYQEVSESFIREFKDKLDWCFVSKYQKLSESFIREFQDRVDWDYISEYQKLSESFLIEFIDRFRYYCLRRNTRIPQDLKDRIIAMKEIIEA